MAVAPMKAPTLARGSSPLGQSARATLRAHDDDIDIAHAA
ncbi:hypothetical protein ACVWZN_002588 [Lysobacter sp. HA35]